MLRAITTLTAISALCCGLATSTAHAQKGMGDATGVAQESTRPDVVPLKGTIREVESGPCENTTGRAAIGTHVLIETSSGEKLNVHLGPQAEVADVAAKLNVGEPISVRAFRTEKMPEHHYVAQVLTIDDQPVPLRDAALRPMWAGGRGANPASGGQQPSAGRGYGRGNSPSTVQGACPAWGGPPQGRGAGRGGAVRGGGNGQGRGQAVGAGRGGGRGQGYGQAAGQGRGQGYRQRRGAGR